MDALRIAACCFSFISLLVIIIALASDHWVDYWLDLKNRHFGLWQLCSDNSCFSSGMDVSGYIHAARAFLLMAMFAGFVSFFGLCASFFRTHVGSVSIKGVAMIASFVAGVCSLIAMASFTGGYNQTTESLLTWYGWSYRLGWASFPLFLITGGLAYKPDSTTA